MLLPAIDDEILGSLGSIIVPMKPISSSSGGAPLMHCARHCSANPFLTIRTFVLLHCRRTVLGRNSRGSRLRLGPLALPSSPRQLLQMLLLSAEFSEANPKCLAGLIGNSV
jgi:hypothetical protein